jgi:ribosomal protein L35AE/L33A
MKSTLGQEMPHGVRHVLRHPVREGVFDGSHPQVLQEFHHGHRGQVRHRLREGIDSMTFGRKLFSDRFSSSKFGLVSAEKQHTV